MLSWCKNKSNFDSGTNISSRLDFVRKIQIQNNQYYIKTVADVLLFYARQDIALGGQCENEFSSNRGNFLEIINTLQNMIRLREKLQSGLKIQ